MLTKNKKTKKAVKENKPKKEIAKKRVTTEMLKKRIIELEGQLLSSRTEYGKLLEQYTNMNIKINTMLGQIIKGLFILGIDPDILMQKCNQMFTKKIKAD